MVRRHASLSVTARSEPGGTREGKWRGNWRMEWVASTLTPSSNMVYPALLKLICTPRLPAVDWTDAPTDLNGLVRFEEKRNLVSARVPSRSARAIEHAAPPYGCRFSTGQVHFKIGIYKWRNKKKIYILSTACIYAFCTPLRTNSNYFPVRH